MQHGPDQVAAEEIWRDLETLGGDAGTVIVGMGKRHAHVLADDGALRGLVTADNTFVKAAPRLREGRCLLTQRGRGTRPQQRTCRGLPGRGGKYQSGLVDAHGAGAILKNVVQV